MNLRHQFIVPLFVLAASPTLGAFEGAQYPTAPSLEAVVNAFIKDIAASDGEVLAKVVKAFMPVKEDLQALVPQHAGKLSFDAGVDELAKAMKQKLLTGITSDEAPKLLTIDCRQESETEEYREVLALLPKETPVFRVVWTGADHRRLAELRSLVYVNNRWVLMPLLTAIPQALKSAVQAPDAKRP